MSSSSATFDPPPASQTLKGEKFRIQDNGSALWLMTALLLGAGYVALRVLSGASDGPFIEISTPENSAEWNNSGESSSIEQPLGGELHKLRPQTLESPSQLGSLPLSGVGDPGLRPAAHWNELSPPPALPPTWQRATATGSSVPASSDADWLR